MEQKAYTSYDQIPLVLRVDDLIQILGISRNTIYDYIRCGRIHAVRVGRKILVSKDSLRAFFEPKS